MSNSRGIFRCRLAGDFDVVILVCRVAWLFWCVCSVVILMYCVVWLF